jgi:hypothetical protein
MKNIAEGIWPTLETMLGRYQPERHKLEKNQFDDPTIGCVWRNDLCIGIESVGMIWTKRYCVVQ